jgi:hypothetical protein
LTRFIGKVVQALTALKFDEQLKKISGIGNWHI